MNKTLSNPDAFTVLVDDVPTTYLDISTTDVAVGDVVVNIGTVLAVEPHDSHGWPVFTTNNNGRIETYTRVAMTSRIILA